ncbi:MAG: STM3941 family protein [Rhodanobacteraceae bacterium]
MSTRDPMATAQLPITLYPSRIKLMMLLAVSLGFVALGIWIVPSDPLVGYLNIGFFGLGAVVFVLQLNPKSSFLTLSEEGFTYSAMHRRQFVRWQDVDAFKVVRVGPRRFVGWTCVASHDGQGVVQRANKAISGVGAALPDTYGMAPHELARLLDEQRQRACGQA